MSIRVQLTEQPQNPLPTAEDPYIGHSIGAGKWHKLSMDPTVTVDFKRHFDAFKTALAEKDHVVVANITKAVIFFSRGYISYHVDGEPTPRSLRISEAGNILALKNEIDQIKAITEKVWGKEISTLTYKNDGTMGPYGQSQPVLGSHRDPLIKAKVFPLEKDVIAFIYSGPKFPTGNKLTEYLNRLSTAKHMKKRLRQKVSDRMAAIKIELQGPAIGDAAKKILEDDLLQLRIIYSQLNEDWEETVLPIVMAYTYAYDKEISENHLPMAAPRTPMDVANQIERDLTAHYKTRIEPSKFKSFFGKTPPPMSTFPTDVARQFLAVYQPDVNKGRHDYSEFCLSRGEITAEVFADTFTRYIISKSYDHLRNSLVAPKETFNLFMTNYLQVSRVTKDALVIDTVPAEIDATSSAMGNSITHEKDAMDKREALIKAQQENAAADFGELL